MKIWTIALMLTVVAVASLPAGQSAERVEVRLKATMHQALVDGDLQAAIEQYADIVARAGGNRTVAAQALLQMGHAYGKLGSPEARTAYERVIQDYADQGDIAAEARSRLAALEVEPTPPSPALHTELMWAEARGVDARGGVSPDGDLVTYTDWLDGGNLAIRNLATGESRRLTHTADNGNGANGGDYADQAEPVAEARARLAALEVEPTPSSPALNTELLWADARGVDARGDVSPDGSLVTYTDWSDLGNLTIRNLATGESRRLTRTADNGSGGANGGNYAGSSRISPDGEQVLYDWARSSPVGETGDSRAGARRSDGTAHRVESRRRELRRRAGLVP